MMGHVNIRHFRHVLLCFEMLSNTNKTGNGHVM